MPLPKNRKLRWLPLDNAAKIYPAARRQNWSNVFRLSVTLTEPVDKEVLRGALEVTVRRFPSMCARLRRGLFWYYLEESADPPQLRQEASYPLIRMNRKEMGRCALRVIPWGNRIAVEFFHSLTDGNGGLVFLKTLLAEYLQQKYGLRIPAEQGVLDRNQPPLEAELEDSFQKYSGRVAASRRESDAWRISGTLEPDRFVHVTRFRLSAAAVLQQAHSYGVSLTTFLSAAMLMALQNLQQEQVLDIRRRKPVKVLIPVNLRRLFPSQSLRNFALYVIPEIDPRLGQFDFQEICDIVHHRMALGNTAKQMSRMIATNVQSERILAVKLMPLFVKNLVMKAVFNAVGERKSCLSLSNLGSVQLPEAMKPYVSTLDFILGVQATNPYNCGVLSWGDDLILNFVRNIREPALEYHFHRVLQQLGLTATVQSNGKE